LQATGLARWSWQWSWAFGPSGSTRSVTGGDRAEHGSGCDLEQEKHIPAGHGWRPGLVIRPFMR